MTVTLFILSLAVFVITLSILTAYFYEKHQVRSWERYVAEHPSTRYDLKLEDWEQEEREKNYPYWGEGCLDDEEYDARWDWEYLERAHRERREGNDYREALTGKSLELAESCGGPWLDLSQRSYTAAELHEVIVNCLRTAEEEDVRDLIPTVPERYFDLPFDLDTLEDLYETLAILVENPNWEGENPAECWPYKHGDKLPF